MRLAVALLALATLSGCAALPGAPQPEPRIVISPNIGAIEARVMRELRNNPAMRVSSYALSACDTRDAWLPEAGPIQDIQFWRALHRERQLKHMCADKHAALVEQFKAALGVIRAKR